MDKNWLHAARPGEQLGLGDVADLEQLDLDSRARSSPSGLDANIRSMTHPTYLKEKARQLRTERKLTLDEISERLALPRTTIYYWIRDLPFTGPTRNAPWPEGARQKGNEAMQSKYRALREAAYTDGRAEFADLCRISSFRDFVCMYIGEGYKRNRNVVALCNSDPAVARLANRWITKFSTNPVTYSIQFHADQNLDELRAFWAAELSIAAGEIRMQRKSNSNQLNGRTWRSKFGVITVVANDTMFRARLQGWIDCVTEQWLESNSIGA